MQPVILTPCASASAGRVHAGERRQQRRVRVDHPVLEDGQEVRPDQLHEPGQHHQVGAERRGQPGQPLIPGVTVGVIGDPAAERRDPDGGGAVERGARRSIRSDRDHPVGLGIGIVQQRLQQGAGPGGQHHHVLHRVGHGSLSSTRAGRVQGNRRSPAPDGHIRWPDARTSAMTLTVPGPPDGDDRLPARSHPTGRPGRGRRTGTGRSPAGRPRGSPSAGITTPSSGRRRPGTRTSP